MFNFTAFRQGYPFHMVVVYFHSHVLINQRKVDCVSLRYFAGAARDLQRVVVCPPCRSNTPNSCLITRGVWCDPGFVVRQSADRRREPRQSITRQTGDARDEDRDGEGSD